VHIPHGTVVTDGPHVWDEPGLVWDAFLWDMQGDTVSIDLIRSIIRKRKPVPRVCGNMVFTGLVFGGDIIIPF